jgi:hypothetical protein
MKTFVTIATIFLTTTIVNAQTSGTGQRTGTATSQPNGGSSRNSAAHQKGTTGKKEVIPQSHGPRDVTPGSPVGTGGAGEGNGAGSPAGSAIQTKDQTEKAIINHGGHGGNKGSTMKKGTTKRKTGSRQ